MTADQVTRLSDDLFNCYDAAWDLYCFGRISNDQRREIKRSLDGLPRNSSFADIERADVVPPSVLERARR